MTPEQEKKVFEALDQFAQFTISKGARVLASGASGPVVGSAAETCTRKALERVAPEERAIAGTGALVGAMTALKLLFLAGGGIALAPAVAFTCLGAAAVGGLTLGTVKVVKAISE